MKLERRMSKLLHCLEYNNPPKIQIAVYNNFCINEFPCGVLFICLHDLRLFVSISIIKVKSSEYCLFLLPNPHIQKNKYV